MAWIRPTFFVNHTAVEIRVPIAGRSTTSRPRQQAATRAMRAAYPFRFGGSPADGVMSSAYRPIAPER